jgi:hypothetical protein
VTIRSSRQRLTTPSDPVEYARTVLKVQWWAKQVEIARALTQPPYRVLVKASHSVGKSHVAAGLVNWWYDRHDPGIVLTTAPTARQVRDVLWKEIRIQRRGRGGFPGPKIPRLESSPNHFAHGFTARDDAAFQGQHGPAVLIVLDEAVGVDASIWEAADSMTMGVHYGIVALCNPTDASSEFYRREQSGLWTVIHISCLDHPNIAAELAGHEPPYPSAIRLQWLRDRLAEWASPVTGDPRPTDIEWPPGSGAYLRPGPLAEARLLGRWPSTGNGVWSDTLWSAAERSDLSPPPNAIPEIGVDVARFGDDDTAIHVRWGPRSLHHEQHNGWSAAEICGRLRELCRQYATLATQHRPASATPIKPEQICCKIDQDGIGGAGIVDHAAGHNWIGISAASTSRHADDYPNVRSELWFSLAGRALGGSLDVSRLPDRPKQALRLEAMAPTYKLDAQGRRVVEPKADTKRRLGRSPDGMDAMNLAYLEWHAGVASWVDAKTPDVAAKPFGLAARRNRVFGLR